MIDIIFDGPPGPEAGRFVEVEDGNGRSIRVGEWIERQDGYWALRIERANKLPLDPDFIDDLREFLGDQEDADHNGEGFVPNRAMRLLQRLNELSPPPASPQPVCCVCGKAPLARWAPPLCSEHERLIAVSQLYPKE